MRREVRAVSNAALAVALGLAAAGPAGAFDANDIAKLAATGNCPGCDLSGYLWLMPAEHPGADLTGANLSNSTMGQGDLVGANLTGANLTGTNLGYSDLTGANLTRANMTGARVSFAVMSGVIYCGTTMPDGRIDNSGC